jgi:hypothetical protein
MLIEFFFNIISFMLYFLNRHFLILSINIEYEKSSEKQQ